MLAHMFPSNVKYRGPAFILLNLTICPAIFCMFVCHAHCYRHVKYFFFFSLDEILNSTISMIIQYGVFMVLFKMFLMVCTPKLSKWLKFQALNNVFACNKWHR